MNKQILKELRDEEIKRDSMIDKIQEEWYEEDITDMKAELKSSNNEDYEFEEVEDGNEEKLKE